MNKKNQYVIRGGKEGRERLRILSNVMKPTTLELFERVGIPRGAKCLDLGCGGGDVTLELAQLVGEEGEVVGLDMDASKIDIARIEAEERGIHHITYKVGDVMDLDAYDHYDVVYARFLLTHLPDPLTLCHKMERVLKKGGVCIVEDIDFSGNMCYPPSPAYDTYMRLYTSVVLKKGADPLIGPKLPSLLLDASFQGVDLNVIQPSYLRGEGKHISSLTLTNIAPAVIAENLATEEELDMTIKSLRAYEEDEATMASVSRMFQAWGYKK